MNFLELGTIGVVAGIISGFFGVGGGMVSVPLLLYVGIDIKSAIGISTTQMVFSSVFGTIRNIKKGKFQIKKYYPYGVGAVGGSFLGANCMHLLPEKIVGYILLSLITFALLRISFTKIKEHQDSKTVSFIVALGIGVFIGVFSGMLGVGGSIIFIPILVGFLHYNTKEASNIGLFFVVFSSVSGFLTLFYLGYIDFQKALIVAVASLAGVYIGQMLQKLTHIAHHKRWTVTLYSFLFVLTSYKIIFQ